MKNIFRITLCLVLLSGCKNNRDEFLEQVLPPDPEIEIELGTFNLVFPDNNLICTEGEDTGNDEVSINFMWTGSANATAYDLEITNQETNTVINESSTSTEKSVVLPKGVQFSWNVTAKLEDDTKESDPWSFLFGRNFSRKLRPFSCYH
ncbi:MAG: hypothetical protein AB8B59_06735 [Maribacter sp.]